MVKEIREEKDNILKFLVSGDFEKVVPYGSMRQRNKSMLQDFCDGVSVRDLARKHCICTEQVYDILDRFYLYYLQWRDASGDLNSFNLSPVVKSELRSLGLTTKDALSRYVGSGKSLREIQHIGVATESRILSQLGYNIPSKDSYSRVLCPSCKHRIKKINFCPYCGIKLS